MAKNIKVLLDKSALYEAIDALLFLKADFDMKLNLNPPEPLLSNYHLRIRMINSAVDKLNKADLS